MNFNRQEFFRYPSKANEEIRKINGGKLYRFTQPEFYLKMDVGLKMMLSVIPRWILPDMSILEYGCNTGKCLSMLHSKGYTNLTGLEISPEALELGRKHYNGLEGINIINAPLEDVVNDLPEFDVIYGVGVLMHLPYDLDWVIHTLFSKAKYLIMTAENEEETDGYFKFARNYKDIIEPLGWAQIKKEHGDQYPPYPHSTIKRVFLRDESQSFDEE
jgi:2-polyprenyl-3-methyl-5-hydroxy-6-metoxy-1,4-benzoquinol methylase